MTVPVIDPMPTAPSRNMTPTVFVAAANAFVAALVTLATQINVFIVWLAELGSLYILSMSGTSTTSLTIGTGSKTLTTQAGLGYRPGASIYVADASNNQMLGLVTSYSGTTLIFLCTAVRGSGTASSWTIGPAVLDGTKANPSQTTAVAKGNSGTGTVTFDVAAGEVQTLTNNGAHTKAFTWPSGHSEIEIIETNAGANASTWPTVNWIKGDGTVSTTFSTMGVALQASGVNHFLLWSPNGGTTVYGRAI
jgi:hypothetical protein